MTTKITMPEKFRREGIDCVNSLQAAMQDCGGSVLNTITMEKMSLMEFMTTIAAQNGIRFCYVRQPADSDLRTDAGLEILINKYKTNQ